MASLKEELYALYKKAEAKEVFDAFKETEMEIAIKERDDLLVLYLKLNKEGPIFLDSVCRHCDAPMGMCKWDDQYCHACKGD